MSINRRVTTVVLARWLLHLEMSVH